MATGKHIFEVYIDKNLKWPILCLWCTAELALIGVDIQEVIGSAIAIQTLSYGVVPI